MSNPNRDSIQGNLLIAPSSDPSAHSSSPSLTQLFGMHVPLHFLLSGFVQPASLQSNSEDLHVDVVTKEKMIFGYGAVHKLR